MALQVAVMGSCGWGPGVLRHLENMSLKEKQNET